MNFEETFEQMSTKEQMAHTAGMQVAGTLASFAAGMMARKLYTAAVMAYKVRKQIPLETED